MIEILLALVAGILTIAAPCILLPLPIILGSSVGAQNKTRPIFITLGFIISFATLALTINFLVASLGVDPNTLRNIAVVMLAIFAIFMIWPTPFERLMAHLSGLINKTSETARGVGKNNFGGFILGVIIGIIWAPCAGPILGSILTLIALENNLGQASILLVAYSIGAGLPMLAIAYGGQALTTKIKSIAKYSNKLQQIFGLILLALSFAIYFQYDTLLQAKLVEKLPSLQTGFEQKIKDKLSPQNEPGSNTEDKANSTKINLQDFGPAPEFSGITNWLNSPGLPMQELRGKVVLVDFWTYSCINCINTLPYVTKWYDTYKEQGLVVVGVHSPEFAFEKLTSNVTTAIKRHKINYPVAQDNDFQTWRAYNNQYWPAHYLIDQSGKIVYTHFGEGKYQETENVIRQLLGLSKNETSSEVLRGPSGNGSPEMYFGTNRLEYLSAKQQPLTTLEQAYTISSEAVKLNTFVLEGVWKFDPEQAKLSSSSPGGGKIKLKYHSKNIYMVAESPLPVEVKIIIDGAEQAPVKIQDADLYTLFKSEEAKDRIIEIVIPEGAEFKAFTFTFS